jgi:hypothetical protein
MTIVTIVFSAGCVLLLADALFALIDPRRYVGAPRVSAPWPRNRLSNLLLSQLRHFVPGRGFRTFLNVQ